jgi:hypothetical protein
LKNSPELPGILLRPWQMIDAVYEGIEMAGCKPQKDVAVAVADYYQPLSAKPKYPVIRSTLTLEEYGERLAGLLLASVQGKATAAEGVLVPVRLESPVAFKE